MLEDLLRDNSDKFNKWISVKGRASWLERERKVKNFHDGLTGYFCDRENIQFNENHTITITKHDKLEFEHVPQTNSRSDEETIKRFEMKEMIYPNNQQLKKLAKSPIIWGMIWTHR